MYQQTFKHINQILAWDNKSEAFQVLGSFINGQDAILFKWAEFSVQVSGKTLSVTQVLNDVLKSPVTERDILESKELYRNILKTEGQIRCVWSGDTLTRYDIDHIIPFKSSIASTTFFCLNCSCILSITFIGSNISSG